MRAGSASGSAASISELPTQAPPQNFGGRQWFFMCPYLGRRWMVLWMPPIRLPAALGTEVVLFPKQLNDDQADLCEDKQSD